MGADEGNGAGAVIGGAVTGRGGTDGIATFGGGAGAEGVDGTGAAEPLRAMQLLAMHINPGQQGRVTYAGPL